jgi:hypothetical protein
MGNPDGATAAEQKSNLNPDHHAQAEKILLACGAPSHPMFDPNARRSRFQEFVQRNSLELAYISSQEIASTDTRPTLICHMH